MVRCGVGAYREINEKFLAELFCSRLCLKLEVPANCETDKLLLKGISQTQKRSRFAVFSVRVVIKREWAFDDESSHRKVFFLKLLHLITVKHIIITIYHRCTVITDQRSSFAVQLSERINFAFTFAACVFSL